MTRRAAIVLPSGPDVWRVANLTEGFTRVAEDLSRDGFAVDLIVPPGASARRFASEAGGVTITRLAFTAPTILAGPGPAHLSASLRLGCQLWRRLVAEPVDIVLAPLVGGVLQPSLMSRSIAESLDAMAMVVWGEATTSRRLELGDIEPAGVGALIDDALETTTLDLADAVAGPQDGASRRGRVRLAFPGRSASSTVAQAPFIDEVVFVGPASGRHGTPASLAEIERLGHAGKLAGRRVTFLGPWREGPRGLGKAMLGRRARDWNFAFTQIDEPNLDEVLRHLCRPGVLAVFAGAAADDEVLLSDAIAAGAATAVCAHHPLADLYGAIDLCAPDLSNLESFLEPGARKPPSGMAAGDWAREFEALIVDRQARPASPSDRPPSASLCITHRDRPAELNAALKSRGASIGPRIETVVIDTGSNAAALEHVTRLESDDIRILKHSSGARQSRARNVAVENSSGEILVFLDDDNLFVDNGLDRLLRAFANPDVDLVVSTLSLYDSAPDEGAPPAAELAFMGRTGAAGLLFNGFGDANFAIRRDRFVELGGFADNDVAAFDWVFLAKAQAAGLRIHVLQKPAIGYRRDLAGRDTKWRKHDLEGPRGHVLGAYALSRSSVTIFALAQTLALPIVE